MVRSLVNDTTKVLQGGGELVEANHAMVEAVHDFLKRFCPVLRHESLPVPFRQISNYGNDAWGLKFDYQDRTLEVRSDGQGCLIRDYVALCVTLSASQEILIAWTEARVDERRRFAAMADLMTPRED